MYTHSMREETAQAFHAYTHFRDLLDHERNPRNAWILHVKECLQDDDKKTLKKTSNYYEFSRVYKWNERIIAEQEVEKELIEREVRGVKLSTTTELERMKIEHEAEMQQAEIKHKMEMQKKRFALERLEVENAFHAQQVINEKLLQTDTEDIPFTSVANLMKSADSVREKIINRYEESKEKEEQNEPDVVNLSELGNSVLNDKIKDELNEIAKT